MREMVLSAPAAEGSCVWEDVAEVCRRIPPLWDLRNYVAVNPFLGFAHWPVGLATQAIETSLGASVLPGLDYYRQRWAAGAFGPEDLPAGPVRTRLESTAPCPAQHVLVPATLAERHDREHGTEWVAAIRASVARWCAVHASGGGTYWRLPATQGLYESWREAAEVDVNLEIAGLRGWRGWARRLPWSVEEALPLLLGRVNVAPEHRVPYLYRLLGGLYGWASYFRREGWAEKEDEGGAVADLLTILLATEAAVAELGRGSEVEPVLVRAEDPTVRLELQEALEDGYLRGLLGRLAPAGTSPGMSVRPEVQAVFCIDVRSEPFRRHLEAAAPGVQTRGFAGFFGVALDWGGSARCPVLLKPSVTPQHAAVHRPSPGAAALKHARAAPASAFSYVELTGLVYGLGLAADALGLGPGAPGGDGREPVAVSPNVALAENILRGMGFRDEFARLILLCGHEGHSANNPHAAALDCGACGGHGGAANARVAARLLNDPAVRAGLARNGWDIPADTHFLPAVHDTATDTVELLDGKQVAASHRADLERLRDWLARAGEATRRERAAALGMAELSDEKLLRALQRRSRDWSEVRPEWGLARNAAFLAARRSRSRGADLEGRVFLHEYDASSDPDDAVLTLILTAPVVVASWINLQYLASTVDNATFGAGTKTLHNRVGDLGVVLGNGGDLRTGLPVQSVHGPDGRWFHEPLRLQVILETTPKRIDAVLAKQPEVRALVENGWLRLHALPPEGDRVLRREAGGTWADVGAVGDSGPTP